MELMRVNIYRASKDYVLSSIISVVFLWSSS